MAALELYTEDVEFNLIQGQNLRIVPQPDNVTRYLQGPLVANRRAARARMKQRRRRSAIALLFVASLILLAWPGHAFGGTNGAGLSTDLASSSTLASGMVYVVQPGDTVASIARLANPVDPSLVRNALVEELHSSVVVTGEHVLIP